MRERSGFERELEVLLQEQAPAIDRETPAESLKCKQAWQKFLDGLPAEVREALIKQGPEAAVSIAIHNGIRDLNILTKLAFYSKYGGTDGYCPIKTTDAKMRWNSERLRNMMVLARPSPPLAQKGGIKCTKHEVKLDVARPDKTAANITGRYEHRFLREDEDEAAKWKKRGITWGTQDKKFRVVDFIVCVNQAGKHIQGIMSSVLLANSSKTDRGYLRFRGDLQANGSYVTYAIKDPSAFWGYFTFENGFLYWQIMPSNENKPEEPKVRLVKVSDEATLFEHAFSDTAFPPYGTVHQYEWWPLTAYQIKNLMEGLDESRVTPLLRKYFSVPAGTRVLEKNASLDAALPFHRYLEEVFTHKYYGIHKVDLELAQYYARTILSRQKVTYKQMSRSLLDWIQIMLDVQTGNDFLMPNITTYLGLKPTVPQGSSQGRAIDPAAPPHKYEVSLSLKGYAVYYRGQVTVSKTSGKKWGPETYNITLKGLQVKPGPSINESGEAQTYFDWQPPDIPGSVEYVSGQLGGQVPGIKATGGAWFMHVFGSKIYPYMDVLGTDLDLKVNLSKKSKINVVNLAGLWGDIKPKSFPVKDYSNFVPVTNYAAEYGLQDDVHFCLDSALLTADARQALRLMCANELALLKSSASKLKIVGHTDRSADDDYNLKLSKYRSLNAKQALKDILGGALAIPDGQIECIGKGESEAKGDGRPDKEVNPKYRRVDIFLNGRLVISLMA